MVQNLRDWLRLIRQIRRWLEQAHDKLDAILRLPDLEKPEEVYEWCRNVALLAQQAAELTPMQTDDQVVRWLLEVPLASLETFRPYYDLFRAVIRFLEEPKAAEAAALRVLKACRDDTLELLADQAGGLQPFRLVVLVIEIIRLILQLARTNSEAGAPSS